MEIKENLEISKEKKKSFDEADVEKLYNAFVSICDYVEQNTTESCAKCPHNSICFGSNGISFANSLQKIRETIQYNKNLEQ